MKRILLGTILVAACGVVVGCLHAPMPWSPDGKWIAYTVEARPFERILRPGWLFEDPRSALGSPPASPGPTTHRLWATRADTGRSVLIEESNHPMTAPGWSPDGRSLAFGRVVDQADGAGRFEVVVSEGPTHQRVVSSRPLPEIGAEASRLPGQAIAWSPDARFLAVPQLHPQGLAIVRADNGRQINIIADGFLPSWSPDGSRLAFYLRGTGDTLNCLDSPTGQARLLADVGQASQAPAWTKDGLTLLYVARKAVGGAEPPAESADLIRIRVDTGLAESIRSLTSGAILGRDRAVEGVSFTFDNENIFWSAVLEGSPQQITWYHPRENAVYKQFFLIDYSAKVGSLSISPDGRTLAARLGSLERLGAPALCDLESNDLRARLIAPDDSSRLEWISTLISAARQVLAGLPTTSSDPAALAGQRLDRPTMLPLPGEFEAGSEPVFRLRRIGKLGRPLCDRPAGAPPADPAIGGLLAEARLFFDYLSENYSAALASLESLEACQDNPRRLVALIGVRAQIALAQGNLDRADRTIEFLSRLEPRTPRTLEWDGDRLVVSSFEPASGGPPARWSGYLKWHASKVREQLHDEGPKEKDHFNPDAPRVNFGFEPIQPRINVLFPDRPFLNEAIDPDDRRALMPRLRMPTRDAIEAVPKR